MSEGFGVDGDGPVDHDVRVLSCGIGLVVLIFGIAPCKPVVQCISTVAFETATKVARRAVCRSRR